MPHVDIKCYPGRTEEQKQKCADQIALVVADTMNCDLSDVSIAIKDVAAEDWTEKVRDAIIVPNKAFLYKKPGYLCED